MKYLISLTDRWGVDTENILICDTKQQAVDLVKRYDLLKERFNNLDEGDIQHRKNEIPKLTEDLQLSVGEIQSYLRSEWEMYFKEINCIKQEGI